MNKQIYDAITTLLASRKYYKELLKTLDFTDIHVYGSCRISTGEDIILDIESVSVLTEHINNRIASIDSSLKGYGYEID